MYVFILYFSVSFYFVDGVIITGDYVYWNWGTFTHFYLGISICAFHSTDVFKKAQNAAGRSGESCLFHGLRHDLCFITSLQRHRNEELFIRDWIVSTLSVCGGWRHLRGSGFQTRWATYGQTDPKTLKRTLISPESRRACDRLGLYIIHSNPWLAHHDCMP